MKEVLMDTIARLDKEIEETRRRLADLETARATILSLGIGQSATRPSAVESFRKVKAVAPKARGKVGKLKKVVPTPKPAPAPTKKPARVPTRPSGLKGAAAFKSFSIGGRDGLEPTIKEKIVRTLGDGTPRTSAEIFEANGDAARKASYWSTLTTMAKKKEVVRTDDRYSLPAQKPAEDQATTAH